MSRDGIRLSKAETMDRAVSSIFVLGATSRRGSMDRSAIQREEPQDLSSMSREELGGVEYRALRLLLRIVTGEFSIWSGVGV